MAVIDPTTETVVIRIVYDGAPFAGKTTSVRALGRGLGGTVRSPGEIAGRTLFFDWLDYTGGLFEGRRIRCQIVSVPGQAVLAPRRRRLLDSADVIVYVLDSSPEAFSAERGYLEGLKVTLGRRTGPPIGIVVQANKRDIANATTIVDLRAMIDAVGIRAAIVESEASNGSGIRETFVFAVRLALDRVRELLGSGQLLTQKPEVNDDRELLEELNRHDLALESVGRQHSLQHTRLSDIEAVGVQPLLAVAVADDPSVSAQDATAIASAPSIAAQALNQVIAESTSPTPGIAGTNSTAAHHQLTAATLTPLMPDDRVASGFIWPVVVGRTILSELTGQPCELRRSGNGEWAGDSQSRWWVIADATSAYDDLERGRLDLVHWARMHVSCATLLSADRCIVLSKDHGGKGRMWQVFRVEPTLKQEIECALAHYAPAKQVATLLLASVLAFNDIQARSVVIGQRLPLSLCDIAIGDVRASYVGRMPGPRDPHAGEMARLQAHDAALEPVLDTEFEFARVAIVARRGELLGLLDDPMSFLRLSGELQSGRHGTYSAYLRRASPSALEQAMLGLIATLVQI